MWVIHLLVALYVSYMDYSLPFPGSEATAKDLATHNLLNRPIAVYPLELVQPLALFLGKDRYHLGSGMVERCAVFNKTSNVQLLYKDIVMKARSRLAETNGQAVSILPSIFRLQKDEFHLLDLVPETTIVTTEQYAIYTATKLR